MRLFQHLPRLYSPSRLAVFLALICLPFSVAGVNLFLGLALLLALLSREWWVDFPQIIKNPLAMSALALLLLFLIGVEYSSAPPSEALKFLGRYRKLLLLPILLPLFKEERHRKIALICLVVSTFISVLISWGEHFGITHLSNPAFGDLTGDSVFKTHITQGYLFTLVVVGSAALAWASNSRLMKSLWALIALMTVGNIAFVMWGKTGKVTLIIVALWLVWEMIRQWQSSRLMKVILLGLACILIFGVTYTAIKRPHLALGEIRTDIEKAQKSGEVTSQGLRVQFAKIGLQIISSSPLIGHGTGSVVSEYDVYAKVGKTPIERETTTNLHNEYLMEWAQVGLPGFVLFLLLLYLPWKKSLSLAKWHGMALRGTIIVFAFGCLFNSYLLDFTEGYTYLLLLSVLVPL